MRSMSLRSLLLPKRRHLVAMAVFVLLLLLVLYVVTKNGEDYQGYLVRETASELVLRDVLQNKEIRLRRDTIQEKKQNGSVMPNGLADLLTRAEFRDLIRFLSELGKPGPQIESKK